MSKILITGGAGYIGTHTVVELLNRGYNIIVVDNLCNSDIKAIENVREITGKDISFYKTDLRDYEGLKEIFSKNDISGVIHFAGLKAVGESVENPLLYYENNVCGSLVLFKLMKEHKVNKIIFSSSATVYGNPEKLPIDESCRLDPANPYGNTKLMIENILKDAVRSDPEFCAVILRYFNPVGAHESGLIGEDPKGIPNNLAPYIVRVATGELPHVNVFGNDYPTSDGTGVRDYIHVVDLALGHIAAWENKNEPGAYVYNLGTGIGYSVLEVINAFQEATKKSIPYIIAKRRPGDIASCYADNKKAKEELGWKAKHDLDDMCASMWKFQKNRRKI